MDEYSNREIDRMFSEIQDTLKRIEEQTTRTNGRVSKLENWRNYIGGALAVISFIVLPLISWVWIDKVSAVVKVQDQLSRALQPQIVQK